MATNIASTVRDGASNYTVTSLPVGNRPEIRIVRLNRRHEADSSGSNADRRSNIDFTLEVPHGAGKRGLAPNVILRRRRQRSANNVPDHRISSPSFAAERPAIPDNSPCCSCRHHNPQRQPRQYRDYAAAEAGVRQRQPGADNNTPSTASIWTSINNFVAYRAESRLSRRSASRRKPASTPTLAT